MNEIKIKIEDDCISFLCGKRRRYFLGWSELRNNLRKSAAFRKKIGLVEVENTKKDEQEQE